MLLKGKTALIAGGGRNLGKAIALTYAREGADLVLIARERKENLDEVARACEALGAKVLPLLADIGVPAEVERLVEQAWAAFGKVDVLVNAAGMRPRSLPWDYTYEQWHRIFAVNLHSTFYLTKVLAPRMIERKQGGSIIALGGMASLTASGPSRAANVASKHGLYGFIKSLAQALGPHGIRANLLAPGTIESVRVDQEWYPSGTAETPAALAATPLRRFGKPQEVGEVALFLASELSSYVTGDRICCMGGQYM